MAIKCITEKNRQQVDVKNEKRRDGEWRFSHLDDRVFTPVPHDATHGIEDDGVDHPDGNKGDPKAIPVVHFGPVMAIWISINHFRREKRNLAGDCFVEV